MYASVYVRKYICTALMQFVVCVCAFCFPAVAIGEFLQLLTEFVRGLWEELSRPAADFKLNWLAVQGYKVEPAPRNLCRHE